MPRPRFTLRVILAVTAIVAVVAWQVGIVKQRQAALVRSEGANISPSKEYVEGFHNHWLISIRQYFGDRPLAIVYLSGDATIKEMDQMKALFPEAEIKRLSK